MALTQRVVSHYDSWTQVGTHSWTISGTHAYQTAIAYSDLAGPGTYSYEIKTSFDATGVGRASKLTVWARVLKNEPDPPPGYSRDDGYARGAVYLKDADGVEHLLWEQEGSLGEQAVLNEYDFKALITKAGTYWLILRAQVKSAWIYGVGGDSYHESYVTFGTLDLQLNDTTIDYEVELDEVLTRVESFISGITCVEHLDRIEYFTIIKTTPLVSKDEKLLAAKSDQKVYDFEQGDPDGRFDTKDEDFGMPGVDKTLCLVTFGSYADAPHTVEVWLSMNSGLTWEPCGQATVSKGTTGLVGVWATAEKHRISFRGAGLQLDSFSLYAIPRGPEVPAEAETD